MSTTRVRIFFRKEKVPKTAKKSHFRDLQGLAEDKRFAQFAVPESAVASRCLLGFFDPFTSSSLAELDRRIRLVRLYSYRNSSSPQKAGFSGTPYSVAVSSAGRARSKRSRRAKRGSRLESIPTAQEKGTTPMRDTFFWRRTRDSKYA
ncbi:hypothetical protein JKK62_01920 [Ruminococcus sp. M6(2020)]|uniref:Uncharacterized protein n=2 Tax=Ruminococcus difficilis TaxID=2763069 RepID=A0A934TYB5_9FIRM|nr:hypothetical protein [Ruminococcus difficilis]